MKNTCPKWSDCWMRLQPLRDIRWLIKIYDNRPTMTRTEEQRHVRLKRELLRRKESQ